MKNMFASHAAMFTIRQRAIPITELNRVLLLKIYRKTGYVRYAESVKKILRKRNKNRSLIFSVSEIMRDF